LESYARLYACIITLHPFSIFLPVSFYTLSFSTTNKGKIHPIKSHEGPQGEEGYRCTLSLTLALDGGAWSTPRPGRFTPGKETWYPRQGRSGHLRKISRPLGIPSPDCPFLNESLYRRSNLGPRSLPVVLNDSDQWKLMSRATAEFCSAGDVQTVRCDRHSLHLRWCSRDRWAPHYSEPKRKNRVARFREVLANLCWVHRKITFILNINLYLMIFMTQTLSGSDFVLITLSFLTVWSSWIELVLLGSNPYIVVLVVFCTEVSFRLGSVRASVSCTAHIFRCWQFMILLSHFCLLLRRRSEFSLVALI
jgi:hypothetical protein